VGEELAASGWFAVAVDLRGHTNAPRADDYRMTSYASDLPAGPWDLVVGHSLGSAVAVTALTTGATRPSTLHPSAALTAAHAILLDPVLLIGAEDRDAVLADQLAELDADPATVREEVSTWDPRDIEEKIAAARAADRAMVEGTFADNPDWDLVAQAKSLTVPTLVVAADPDVFTMFPTDVEGAITEANPAVTVVRIAGAGHSPHRDRPEETLAVIREWLG
jgi:pimeloyl-ACP methyl ester carboxylesterase